MSRRPRTGRTREEYAAALQHNEDTISRLENDLRARASQHEELATVRRTVDSLESQLWLHRRFLGILEAMWSKEGTR